MLDASSLKPLNQFEPNVATIILRVSSLKFVSDNWKTLLNALQIAGEHNIF
jgi:hypothetical protein